MRETSNFDLCPLSVTPHPQLIHICFCFSKRMRPMWTCGLPFSFPHKLSACLSELILAKPSGIRKYHLLVPFPHWGKKNHRKRLHCTHPFPTPQMLFYSLSSCFLPTSLLCPPSFLLLARGLRHRISHTPLHVDCCLQHNFYQTHALKCYLEGRSEGRLSYSCFW